MDATATSRILSVCLPGGALYLRNAVLQSAGFGVVAAVGMAAALAALEGGLYELVVIGHLYSLKEKNTIASKAKSKGMKVLCMYSEAAPPPVADADAFVSNTQPEQLVSLVRSMTSAPGAAALAAVPPQE